MSDKYAKDIDDVLPLAVKGAEMESLDSKREDTLYDRDFMTWTERQSTLLREGRFDIIDVANIVEEIESLGKSQLAALRSSYRLIAMHLLKLMEQPEKAAASCENTINRERGHVADLLEDNAGMKPKRPELFAKAYASARSEAAFVTRIDIRRFPEKPPFTLEEVEDKAFWPSGFPRAQLARSRYDKYRA